jgi:hypothetical protein
MGLMSLVLQLVELMTRVLQLMGLMSLVFQLVEITTRVIQQVGLMSRVIRLVGLMSRVVAATCEALYSRATGVYRSVAPWPCCCPRVPAGPEDAGSVLSVNELTVCLGARTWHYFLKCSPTVRHRQLVNLGPVQ